ncbi:uncharacterized protein LOC141896764 isoform X1 [Acropora palmata]|uniref:uncharacterized protein LOC141896764 isoform X1 n=1 Tax=Acropora palmata TaxID=6131 RepID=UPI003DA19838
MRLHVSFVGLMITLTAGAVVSKQSATNSSHYSCECLGRVRRIEVNDTDYPVVSCDEVCFEEYRNECHSKEKTDARLIITKLNVTFFDKDNGSSWYALVHWNPLEFSEPWIGYCVNYNAGLDYTTGLKTDFFSKDTRSANITSEQWWKDVAVSVAVFGLSMSEKDTEVIIMHVHRQPTPSSRTPKMVSGTTHPSKEGGSKAVTFVAVSVGSAVGVILVAGILWYFYRQKKGDTPLPQDFQYHAFIIYNHEDRHWMKKQLLPLLEEKHHLTCCIHYKDFIPGKPIRDNMADSVYTSYKVIALFSNNFVKSNCCMYELDVAVNRLVQRRDNSLAIIRIDGADWKHLPEEVRGRCSIDYHYPQERPFWRKRLLKFLNLPEECRIQSTSKEPAKGINNDENDSENLRVELTRLQSTESNASEISFLSLQPNLHQEPT